MEPNQPEEKTKLDMLEKRLYSRGVAGWLAKRKKLEPEQYEVNKEWSHESEQLNGEEGLIHDPHFRLTFLKKVLLFSGIFFTVALAYSMFSFFRGTNSVSTDNIAISVAGPVSVGGGEILPLDITVENKNNAPIELASLTVEYPEGSKSAENINLDKSRDRNEIGALAGGESKHIQSKAVLFGEEGSTKEIKVTFEYRIKGSNASFEKPVSYLVGLSSAPVGITLSSLKEINSGQSTEITLDIVSNSATLIKNLLVKAEYPFGFTFENASPAPSSQKNVWSLGDLPAGGKRTIKIRGKIDGQDGEERIFKFTAGVAKASGSSIIGTAFLTSSQSISIKKPFIGLALSLDGDSSVSPIAGSGKIIHGEIAWANNLQDQIFDGGIVVKFSGVLLDQSSVTNEKGFYRSSDNTITWDKSNTEEMRTLNPGDSGKFLFNFKLLAPQGGVSPQIHIDVSAKGNRLSDSNVPEQITSLVSRDLKISTNANLVASALYSIGPFTNSGPLPPRVDQETSYTIVWSVTNSSNTVSGAKVSAILPPYMKWKNAVSPSSESVTFNPVASEVVWDLGQIQKGTGIGSSPREVYFQVTLEPSASQVEISPVLVGNATLTATDDFTGGDVTSTRGGVSTNLVNDPNFREGQDKVAR